MMTMYRDYSHSIILDASKLQSKNVSKIINNQVDHDSDNFTENVPSINLSKFDQAIVSYQNEN